MKKAITMFALLAMISGLCAGCKKDADQPKPETMQQTQRNDAKDWEPETAEYPADDSHDGHDHSTDDHSGHDH
jgi:hypothetical protein